MVVDAENGLPINGASLHFRGRDNSWCREDRGATEFTLTTDNAGEVVRKWTGCMCFGTKSRLQDTFAVNLPALVFEVSAPGYETSPWADLESPEYARAVQRGSGRATLVVKVRLRRAETEPAKGRAEASRR